MAEFAYFDTLWLMNFTLINSKENISTDFSCKELENSKTDLLYPNTDNSDKISASCTFQQCCYKCHVHNNAYIEQMLLCLLYSSCMKDMHKGYEYLCSFWALKLTSVWWYICYFNEFSSLKTNWKKNAWEVVGIPIYQWLWRLILNLYLKLLKCRYFCKTGPLETFRELMPGHFAEL